MGSDIKMQEFYKADVKDRKILFELDMNARQTLSKISKKVGLSQQAVNYRIANMEKKGIIRGYRIMLDIAKLGFLSFRLYVRYENVTPVRETEILNYLQKHPNVAWHISTNGRFDLEILILARNFIHFNEIVKGIMNKYGKYLRNSVTSVSIANYHHKKFYLINKKPTAEAQLFYGGEPKKLKIDNIDVRIINILSLNARATSVEIAEKLKLVPNAVKYRIKNLEKKGIIQTYRTWINVFKLGYQWYKALITLKTINKEIENKILQFCRNEQNMLYLVTCIGPWNIEVEAEVPNNEKFREIMTRFRNQFSDLIIDYETLLVYKEYKMDYFPVKKIG